MTRRLVLGSALLAAPGAGCRCARAHVRRGALEASGWALSDDPIPGTLLASPDYDGNYQPSMLPSDGVTYFVSYGRFLSSVAALQ